MRHVGDSQQHLSWLPCVTETEEDTVPTDFLKPGLTGLCQERQAKSTEDWILRKKNTMTSSARLKAVTISVTLPPISPVRREGLSYYSFMGCGPTNSIRTTWDLVTILSLWSLPHTYWVRTQILAKFLNDYMYITVWAVLIWALTVAHSGKEAWSSVLAIPIHHSEDSKHSEPWSIKPPLFFALEAIVFWRGKEITVSLRISGSSPPEDSAISNYAWWMARLLRYTASLQWRDNSRCYKPRKGPSLLRCKLQLASHS